LFVGGGGGNVHFVPRCATSMCFHFPNMTCAHTKIHKRTHTHMPTHTHTHMYSCSVSLSLTHTHTQHVERAQVVLKKIAKMPKFYRSDQSSKKTAVNSPSSSPAPRPAAGAGGSTRGYLNGCLGCVDRRHVCTEVYLFFLRTALVSVT